MKKYTMKINGDHYQARIIEFTGNHAKVEVNGVEFEVEIDIDKNAVQPKILQMEKPVPSVPQMRTDSKSINEVKAPIPGVIISLLKKEGDFVHSGDVILTLEAMKMETEIMAPMDGIIKTIHVREKSPVQESEVLVTLEGVQKEQTVSAPKMVIKEEVKTTPVKESKAQNVPVQTAVKAGASAVVAPLPGIVLDIKVKVGDKISIDQPVVILEAMKMESEIFSHTSGTVKRICVSKGETVNDGQILIEMGD